MFKPYTTAVVLVITAVPSLLQFAIPGLEPALMRDPAAIGGGEWWRLGTALVVQDSGLLGTLFNLVCLAVLGYFAERTFGPARWLTLYAAGAVAGEAAGYLLGRVDGPPRGRAAEWHHRGMDLERNVPFDVQAYEARVTS
ncbi:rhomboid family intramembrane serine protease [Nonomuraea sp. NPDC050451]|uniref:rhomboid family intramembrane serine protease n=1 Tax=Nonomuraea sp. NPDC050451 TaxID=3364364 RepID=UPI00379B0FE2